MKEMLMSQIVSNGHYTIDEAFEIADDIIAKCKKEKKQYNKTKQESTVVIPHIKTAIEDNLDWYAYVSTWKWKQLTELLNDLGICNPERLEVLYAGQIIRKLNRGKQKRSNGKSVLLVPPTKK